MADIEIGARLSVDSGNAGKAISEFQGNVKGAGKELKDTKTSSDEFTASANKLEGAQSTLNPKIKEASGAFAALKQRVGENTPAIGAVTKAFDLLRANPLIFILIAIVAVLKGLYEAFKSTFEGGQKVEQIFAGIGAACQVVFDRAVKLSQAIIKLFSGDFKGAISDAKASVSGIGDEIEKVYTRTAELKKQLQKLDIADSLDEVDKAKREKRLALLREELNDENVSIAHKKQIALELKKDVDDNAKDDLARATARANAETELLLQQADGARKNAKQINDIQIGLLNTQTENALEGVRVNKQIRNLEKQEQAQYNEAAKAAKEKKKVADQKATDLSNSQKANEKAFSEKILRLQNDNELLQIKDANAKKIREIEIQLVAEKKTIDTDFKAKILSAKQRDALLGEVERSAALNIAMVKSDIAKKQNDSEAEANNSFLKKISDDIARQTEQDRSNSEARIALSAREAEAKIENANTVANTLSSISNLVGEQTVIGKALAVSAAIINTYLGATKALAQGGIFGYIGAAGVIAAGLSSVKKIISTKVPGRSDGVSASTSATSISPVQVPLPKQTNTTIDTSSIQAMGSALGRAYVVDAEVTNSQEMTRKYNRAARVG